MSHNNDGEIVLTAVRETEWDEEAVLDSPFDAKDFIKILPWRPYEEEIDEYGSLREKALDREDDITDTMEAAMDAVDAYSDSHGFSDDFATHAQWDSSLNKWTIDADSFDEAREFWEFVGFNVSIDDNVSVDKLS